MPSQLNQEQLDHYRADLLEALEDGDTERVQRFCDEELAPVEIAHVIESSPTKVRELLWQYLDEEQQGDVLPHLNDELQQAYLSQMSAHEILETTQDLDSDDLADMLQQMEPGVSSQVLELMPPSTRAEVEGLLAYPEDTAGGLMNTDVITVRADVTLETVLRYLRRREIPDHLDALWVVNRNFGYVGKLPIVKLLTHSPDTTVREIMDSDIEGIKASTHEDKVAQIFERHDLVSAPVVNDHGILLGRITVDDVLDVIRESADHAVMSMAGLDEDEDTFAPIVKSSRNRAVWLGINMITAFVAAAVMSQFEASIAQIVALAVLSPVVASMGGIAGSQTLTLMIRGMATGHINRDNLVWLIGRELGVGALNGLLWAGVIATITIIWYSDVYLAAVIAAAIIINLLTAVLAGASLPFLLKSVKIDPALSGSVILTTITDVVGFLTFLGLATFFLL
ncbi:magnesium transporter [Saccharospirillum salsuginis]|uniref:Magnesium transporter MgtE n=1 Tax=Saccharospirillum salsuginis TaxID=418750 RepID=A0A918NIL8_9GAMM|nr:magnesium transporter [Saccharospirillum salsuginis]GGX70204.1 magnesium transporter MgtE [Saccharospirillum salsuginis]